MSQQIVKQRKNKSVDPLSSSQRSERMGRVRNRGNKSTELAMKAALRRHKITGWRSHPSRLVGRPDFYFPAQRLAVFIDGCFWHVCPTCDRRLPRHRRAFWKEKLEANIARDKTVNRTLRKAGVSVLRVWEHDVLEGIWIPRLKRQLRR